MLAARCAGPAPALERHRVLLGSTCERRSHDRDRDRNGRMPSTAAGELTPLASAGRCGSGRRRRAVLESSQAGAPNAPSESPAVARSGSAMLPFGSSSAASVSWAAPRAPACQAWRPLSMWGASRGLRGGGTARRSLRRARSEFDPTVEECAAVPRCGEDSALGAWRVSFRFGRLPVRRTRRGIGCRRDRLDRDARGPARPD